MNKEPDKTINRRSDLLKACPHIEKEMLVNVEKYDCREQIVEEEELSSSQETVDMDQDDQEQPQLNPNVDIVSQQVFDEHASSSQDRILTRAERRRRVEARMADYDPG